MKINTIYKGLTALFALAIYGQPLQAQHYIYNQADQYSFNSGCCPTTCSPCYDSYPIYSGYSSGYGYGSSYGSKSKWFAEIDFLYWSSNFKIPTGVDFSAFASTSTFTDFFADGIDLTLNTTNTNLSFSHGRQKWDPGVRIGVGFTTPCDCWDLGAVWTHLTSHRSDASGPLDVGFFGTTLGFDTIHGTAKSRYDTIDLELGRDFQPACKFGLRPFLSVRGAWFDRKHKITFADPEAFTFTGVSPGDPSTTVFVDNTLDIQLRHRVWGVGPRLGLNTTWGNPCGFNIFGNFSAALLYGRNKHNTDVLVDNFTQGASDVTEEFDELHFNHKTWNLFPTIQIALGAAWNHQMDCGNVLTLKASWESNYYWEAENIAIIERSVSFQGLTAGVALSF